VNPAAPGGLPGAPGGIPAAPGGIPGKAFRQLLAAMMLMTIALAGCRTTAGTGVIEKQKAARADAAIAKALLLLEDASLPALGEAAGLLASGDAAGGAKAAALESLGTFLFQRLYPEVPDPFPADSPPPADRGVGASRFFAAAIPALIILEPGARIDDALAETLTERLRSAEGENAHSVIPPYLQGLLLERRGASVAEARAMYEECLFRAPTFYPAGAKLAAIIIAEGAAAAELPRLELLASLLPTASKRFTALARAYLAAGKPQEAADAAAKGLLLSPDDAGFVLLRARAFEAQENWFQSLWILDALLKLKPDEPAAILMKARLLYEKQRSAEEAMSMLFEAEGRFPLDAGFPELRGRILVETGRVSEGIALLTRALSLAPGRVSLLTLLLKVAVQGQQWNQASSWFAQIPDAALTPEHLELGWKVATNLNDHVQAIARAQRLGSLTGGAHPLALEARSMVSAGRPAQAMKLVDHALLNVEAPPAVRADLLVIRSTAGSDDPLRDLRSALLEDPDNLEALVGISARLADQQEYRKAMGYARRAAAISPDNASLAEKVSELETLADSPAADR
jgi:tetratricopeptide (TPR) repeat protein